MDKMLVMLMIGLVMLTVNAFGGPLEEVTVYYEDFNVADGTPLSTLGWAEVEGSGAWTIENGMLKATGTTRGVIDLTTEAYVNDGALEFDVYWPEAATARVLTFDLFTPGSMYIYGQPGAPPPTDLVSYWAYPFAGCCVSGGTGSEAVWHHVTMEFDNLVNSPTGFPWDEGAQTSAIRFYLDGQLKGTVVSPLYYGWVRPMTGMLRTMSILSEPANDDVYYIDNIRLRGDMPTLEEQVAMLWAKIAELEAAAGGIDEGAVNALINTAIAADNVEDDAAIDAAIADDNVNHDDAAYAPANHSHPLQNHVHDKGSGGRMTDGPILVP